MLSELDLRVKEIQASNSTDLNFKNMDLNYKIPKRKIKFDDTDAFHRIFKEDCDKLARGEKIEYDFDEESYFKGIGKEHIYRRLQETEKV